VVTVHIIWYITQISISVVPRNIVLGMCEGLILPLVAMISSSYLVARILSSHMVAMISSPLL
jgi:hypothetical protein